MLLLGLEDVVSEQKSDSDGGKNGADEKVDEDAAGWPFEPPGLAARQGAATQIHGAVWASCSHTPGVLIGAVVLVILGFGALWDAIETGVASSSPLPHDQVPPSPAPHDSTNRGAGSSRSGSSGSEQGWGWAALSEMADRDVALAIIRTDAWASGQTDTQGINSLAGQVRFIDLNGHEIRSPNGQRVRQLDAAWIPEDVVGRHLVLPNSATVATLVRTFAVAGVDAHQLRSLAEDCQASTTTSRDLAPAYRVESLTPSAAPGQRPQLQLAVPGTPRCAGCRDLPMAAFSVVANQAIFQEFRTLAAIPCFHDALLAGGRNAQATTAHMAFMRANSWAVSDTVFVLLCADGWGGRVYDDACVSTDGGVMNPSRIPPCPLFEQLQVAWGRLRDDPSQPVNVQDELRMDEDRGRVFSETEGMG